MRSPCRRLAAVSHFADMACTNVAATNARDPRVVIQASGLCV